MLRSARYTAALAHTRARATSILPVGFSQARTGSFVGASKSGTSRLSMGPTFPMMLIMAPVTAGSVYELRLAGVPTDFELTTRLW